MPLSIIFQDSVLKVILAFPAAHFQVAAQIKKSRIFPFFPDSGNILSAALSAAGLKLPADFSR
jgi:hypothetical protein